MAWVWEIDPQSSDPIEKEGYWRWDQRDGPYPEEGDQRTLAEIGRRGTAVGERVSNDGQDRIL